MLLCKGKILVNIDKGYDYFKEAYCILEKTREQLTNVLSKLDFPMNK